MTLEGILGAPKPQAQSLSVSVAELLRQERTKLVERRMKAKMEELERLLANGNTCPGFIKVLSHAASRVVNLVPKMLYILHCLLHILPSPLLKFASIMAWLRIDDCWRSDDDPFPYT